MSYKSQSHTEFLMGALIGGAIGAVAALLLAPTSGAKLRRQVRDELLNLNGETPPPAKPKAAAHKKTTTAHAQHLKVRKGKTKKVVHPTTE